MPNRRRDLQTAVYVYNVSLCLLMYQMQQKKVGVISVLLEHVDKPILYDTQMRVFAALGFRGLSALPRPFYRCEVDLFIRFFRYRASLPRPHPGEGLPRGLLEGSCRGGLGA